MPGVKLKKTNLVAGTQFQFGSMSATFVCGKPLQDWDIDDKGEFNNAGSIVLDLLTRASRFRSAVTPWGVTRPIPIPML